MKPATLQETASSDAIASIRAALQLSQEAFARMLQVSVRTIVRWEKEGDEPPALERERLELIHELARIAGEIMEKDDIPAWFSTPKAAFSGKKPLDLLSTFRGIQQVRERLEQARWGVF
ncbi:MAG: antitoxin Xre/MbcA/ParS toxin-binding domain-containing protein [Nitrospiria bacterium]